MSQREAPRLPRGRHAPPLEVRQDRQRRRLFAAAAKVFAKSGYAEATAEAISREAGMSKATFYEHFANKEECILALFDAGAATVREAIGSVIPTMEGSSADRARRAIELFLGVIETYPDESRTLLVEIVGAGPQAAQRRDAMLEDFTAFLLRTNRAAHEQHGAPLFQSPEDAYAIVGAVVELVGRQLRSGRPERLTDLVPVIERIVAAFLDPERQPAAA